MVYETEWKQSNFMSTSKEDLWFKLPSAGVHDWWIWTVLSYLYSSEIRRCQEILFSEPALSLGMVGRGTERWSSSHSCNKWIARLVFWMHGLLGSVCIDWGKHKWKCKNWDRFHPSGNCPGIWQETTKVEAIEARETRKGNLKIILLNILVY